MTKRILVIDDHKETLRLTTLILKRRAYEVMTAESGKEGIEMALDSVPDLVLLDIMMPDMNGLDVCRAFRADPTLSAVPIMMFTARTQIEDEDEAREAGANEYITKPTRPKELLERVGEALEKHLVTSPATIDAGDEARAQQHIVAIWGVTKEAGFKFVALNLSAELAKNRPVTLVRTTPSSIETVDGVTIVDAADGPASLAAAIASAPTENVIVIEAGESAETLPPSIFQKLSNALVCFTPDLVSITQTQDIIEQLQNELSESAETDAIMLDFSGKVSVPIETASDFLKYPVLAGVAIDGDLLENSREQNLMLVQAYPDTETTQQIRAIANKVTGAEMVR